MSEASSSPKRPRLDYDDSCGKDDMFDKYKNRDHDDQSSYSQSRQRKGSDGDEDDTKDGDDSKSKMLSSDTARREHTLVLRLTNKEQELQDCHNQIREMKQAQTQNTAQLRSMLLDPAINLLFQRMAREMDEHKEKLKQKQNELSAWKFTPDSQTGMRLMAKCRMLLQENGDLGKMISSGRTARLEGEISLHKALVTEMKKNQKELDEFVYELEEDVEGMQGMIFALQQQLKEARDQIARLQQENEQLRTLRTPPDPEPGGANSIQANSNWPPQQVSPGANNEPDSTATDSLHPSSTRSDTGSKKAVQELTLSEQGRQGPDACEKAPFIDLQADTAAAAQTQDEDSNLGSFAFKVTPDSGVITQEEEEGSMDTSDFPLSIPPRSCDPGNTQAVGELVKKEVDPVEGAVTPQNATDSSTATGENLSLGETHSVNERTSLPKDDNVSQLANLDRHSPVKEMGERTREEGHSNLAPGTPNGCDIPAAGLRDGVRTNCTGGGGEGVPGVVTATGDDASEDHESRSQCHQADALGLKSEVEVERTNLALVNGISEKVPGQGL